MHTHIQYHTFIFKHEYIQFSDIYFPYETGNITNTRINLGPYFLQILNQQFSGEAKQKEL